MLEKPGKTIKPEKPVTPKKPKEKVLSFTDIDKQVKEINKWHKFILEDGVTVIKYKKIFDDYSIQEIMTELYDHLLVDLVKKQDEKFFTDDEAFYTYMYFLMIKHFSHFKDQFKDNSLELNVLRIEKLGLTGYFKLFFDEIFEAKEVLKVIKAIKEKAELMDKLKDLSKDLMDRMTNIPTSSKIDELLEEAKKFQ